MHTYPEIQMPQAGRRRGRYSDEFKRRVIAACLEPGVSTGAIALANGLSANLVRRWVADTSPRNGGLIATELEHRHGPYQLLGLALQALGRGGAFFHQSRVLLRGLVHLGDGFADLGHARTLLGAGRADFAHDVGHAFDAVDHLGHGLAGLAHQGRALLDTGVMKSGSEIAKNEGLHHSVVNELMRLTLLAPDIIKQLMSGTQPRRLNLMWFQRNRLPVDWQAQRAIIDGFK